MQLRAFLPRYHIHLKKLLLQLFCFSFFHSSATAQQYSPPTRTTLVNAEILESWMVGDELPKKPELGTLKWIDENRDGLLALARALDRQKLNSYENKELAVLLNGFKIARIYFPECSYQLTDIPVEDIEIQSATLDDYLKSAKDGLDLVNGRASVTSSDSCKLDNISLSDERTQTGIDYLQRIKGRPALQVCGRSLSNNWETYLSPKEAEGILPNLPLDWSKYAPNAKPTPELRKKEGDQRAEYLAQKMAMLNQSVEIIRIPDKLGFLACPPPDEFVVTDTVRAKLKEIDDLLDNREHWVDYALIGELYGLIDRLQSVPKHSISRKPFSSPHPLPKHQLPKQLPSEFEPEERVSLHLPLINYAVVPTFSLPHPRFLETLSASANTSTVQKIRLSKDERRQIESVNQAAMVCRHLFAPGESWRYIGRNDDMSIQAGDIMDSISGSIHRRLNSGLDILPQTRERVWQRIRKNTNISQTMFFLKPLLGAIPILSYIKSNDELLYTEVSQTSVRYVEERVSENDASQLADDITYALSGASSTGTPRDRPQLVLVVRRVTRACWVQTRDLKASLGVRHLEASSLSVSSNNELLHLESGQKIADMRCQERGPGAVKVGILKARNKRLVIDSERLDSVNMEGWQMTEDGDLARTISYKLEEDGPENQEATIYDIAKHFYNNSVIGPRSSVLRCIVDNYDYVRNSGMWALE